MYSQKVQRIFVRHCKPNQFASCRQILVKLGNHWWSASPRYSWEPDRFIMEAVLYWILIVQDLFGHTSQSMPHKRISRSPSRLSAVIWRDVWCEQLLTSNDAVYWRHTLLGFMFRSSIFFFSGIAALPVLDMNILRYIFGIRPSQTFTKSTQRRW